MAFVAVIEIPGLRTEQYDAILERMDVVRQPAPGIYLHICAPTDDGLRITELWESEAGFRSFVQERMFPAAAELGIQADPDISVKPLHFLFAPRAGEISQLGRSEGMLS
jgi:hypothetical protein